MYFKNTNHGGSSGGLGDVKKGHVEPLWFYFAKAHCVRPGRVSIFSPRCHCVGNNLAKIIISVLLFSLSNDTKSARLVVKYLE